MTLQQRWRASTALVVQLALVWLIGIGVAYGEQRQDRPFIRWESPPWVLNLRLPAQKYDLPVQVEVKAATQDWPSILLPRRDLSHAPWGTKPYVEPGYTGAPRPGPRTVTIVPPASGFIGPNCGQRCAEKRAQGAARTEYRLW